MNLPALKEARAVTTDTLRAIVDTAANENRDLTGAEQEAFDAARTRVEKLERDIRNHEFLADAERRMNGEPVGNLDQKFETEKREFSLRKAIAAQIPGMNVDVGREKEISKELERRSGRSAQGIMCPMSVFEKRVVTTALPVGGPGGALVPTEWGDASFIDILRAKTVVRQLGATVVTGLTGNVGVPKLTKSATAYWVAENAAITASDPEVDMLVGLPKHMGCLTEISRNMVMQTSPDIEGVIRNDFAQLLASGLDTAAINGAGPASNQPVGILNSSSGVTDVPTGASGGPPTYALVLSTISAVGKANAANGSRAFATNWDALTKMSTVLKSTADTSSNFIATPGAGTLLGYPLAVTNLVPNNLVKGGSGAVCSALIFGDWSQLMVFVWSEFDLLVNPYETTAYSKGNVQVRGMMTCDIGLRQPAAFAKIADMTTS
jgi:HK97 family phage major capsid protein